MNLPNRVPVLANPHEGSSMRNVSSAEKTFSLVDESMGTSLEEGRYNCSSLRSRLSSIIIELSQCEIPQFPVHVTQNPLELEISVVPASRWGRRGGVTRYSLYF